MLNRQLIFLFCFILLSLKTVDAQIPAEMPAKSIQALRIADSPKIDGILDEEAWANAPISSGFVEYNPNNGKPAEDNLQTEVKILYNDLGIYFGLLMHDPEPNKILKELTERDNVGNADFIYLLINGYNDHQQSFEFLVSAAGVQYDAKITNGNEDDSWNGIWHSEVKITDEGWVAEIMIPYSEVRFPSLEKQTWGLNIGREFRRNRIRYYWNHVDNQKGSLSLYDGEIQGITNIETPVRLSFLP